MKQLTEQQIREKIQEIDDLRDRAFVAPTRSNLRADAVKWREEALELLRDSFAEPNTFAEEMEAVFSSIEVRPLAFLHRALVRMRIFSRDEATGVPAIGLSPSAQSRLEIRQYEALMSECAEILLAAKMALTGRIREKK